MSEAKPMTIEAEAVSWLLKTSSNKDPAWFQKAVQIAGQSPNARALLFERLLPLLLPLITSLPRHGPGNITSDQEGYINALAVLMDFAPETEVFWRNRASLERPVLPAELVDRLRTLQATRAKCTHAGGSNKEKWSDGTPRCPEACVGSAVDRILQYESEIGDTKEHLKLESNVSV